MFTLLTLLRLAMFFGGLVCLAGGFIYGNVPVIIVGGVSIIVSVVTGRGRK